MTNAQSIPQYLSLIAVSEQGAGSFGFLSILSTLAWGLGYFGVPHVLLRFMAIRQEGELKLARRIGSVWVVISMGAAIVIGVVGRALMDQGLVAGRSWRSWPGSSWRAFWRPPCPPPTPSC